MRNILTLVLFLSLGLAGCVHLNSVSTSSIPVDRSRPVVVQETKFLPFLISFDNGFVDELAKSLAQQCPNGRVEGVLTKQESIMYFPLFVHAYRLTATGYCVGATE